MNSKLNVIVFPLLGTLVSRIVLDRRLQDQVRKTLLLYQPHNTRFITASYERIKGKRRDLPLIKRSIHDLITDHVPHDDIVLPFTVEHIVDVTVEGSMPAEIAGVVQQVERIETVFSFKKHTADIVLFSESDARIDVWLRQLAGHGQWRVRPIRETSRWSDFVHLRRHSIEEISVED